MVAVLLLITALVLWFGLFSEEAVEAVVLRDGIELARLDLRGMEIVEYEPEPGVVIRYGQGTVCFASSDCPDGVCVRTGVLNRAGQTAVCLPNRLVIRVEGEGDVDAISG